jgi:hypothetical protein
VIAMEPQTKTRRLIVRALLVVVYASVMMVAFVLGKGHTILLDNKDSADGSVKAFESVTVSVDGQEPLEFMSGDRDQVKVRSQWHSIEVTVNEQKTVKKFTVPLGLDMALLSIPKLLAGVEPALVPFVLADQPPPPADPDAGNSNEFTSPGGTPEAPVAPAVPVTPAPAAP